MAEILIIAEQRQGQVEKTTLEVISAAREISAPLGAETACVVLGKGVEGLCSACASYGVNRVYRVEHPLLEGYISDAWLDALEQVSKKLQPKAIFMSHSPIGRELAPRLAARLGTGATTDCIDLMVHELDKRIIRTKPIYGGNAVAVLKVQGTPEILTIRKNIFVPAEPSSETSQMVDLPVSLDRAGLKTEVLETKERELVELDKAEVIISGGRGITDLEDFKMLEDLAGVVGRMGVRAMVGCSRPIVDKGWLSSDHQVGLTGTMVGPGIYLAIGISGAIQHLVGMVRSKKIIAINTDPNCNMFKVADYGLTHDYKEILPHLIKKLEELS